MSAKFPRGGSKPILSHPSITMSAVNEVLPDPDVYGCVSDLAVARSGFNQIVIYSIGFLDHDIIFYLRQH